MVKTQDGSTEVKLENGEKKVVAVKPEGNGVHDKGQKNQKNMKEINKKKRKKKKKHQLNAGDSEQPKKESADSEKVEIQWVSAPLEEVPEEMKDIFQKFAKAEDLIAGPKKEGAETQAQEIKPTVTEGEGEEEKLAKIGGPEKPTKKERKKLKRAKVAVLKQLVTRPEVVDIHDVNSAEPLLLVFLKSYRNTVPVPRHWSQKRKYLQGKRGMEKTPFKLPEFIANTGIDKLRQAYLEKETEKKQKQKARDKMAPKMNKMNIDDRVLHDAFFRYQTKPKLSLVGDLYHKGKEFEVKLKEKRPGDLSEDLKKALNMVPGGPPPWLINMQRYGPPPSYPSLKIPGLNAPIPFGPRFGTELPTDWGKPPVDQYGRPFYGDAVFGIAQPEVLPEFAQPIEKKRWGEFEEEEEEEESEEVEGGEDAEEPKEDMDVDEETEGGTTSVSSRAGVETPEVVELRKKGTEEGKKLFTVLEQAEGHVGGALFGSSHKYIIPGSEKKEKPVKDKNAVEIIKSQKSDKINVTFNPAEIENLEDLNESIIKQKYAEAIKEQEKSEAHENMADMVAEQAADKKKKRNKEKAKEKKGYKF